MAAPSGVAGEMAGDLRKPQDVFFGSIGVLFGGFGRQIDGACWFTWWFHHLGSSIYPKKDTYGSDQFSRLRILWMVAGNPGF